MKKRKQIYKGFLEYQSEFSHLFASWAVNHNGWRKMKKLNKKIAKKRERRFAKKDMEV